MLCELIWRQLIWCGLSLCGLSGCGLSLCGADTLVRLVLILLFFSRWSWILTPSRHNAARRQQHNRKKQPKNPRRAPFNFIH